MAEEKYKGKTLKELQEMNQNDLMSLLPARIRRSMKRGLTEQQKILLKKIKKYKQASNKKPIKTHIRDMPIIPEMVGLTIQVHSGKEFKPITLTVEMIGHYLGEFALTRNKTSHSAPGVGATRSSAGAKKKWFQ